MRSKKSRQQQVRRFISQFVEGLEDRRLLAASIALEFGSQEVKPGDNGLDVTHIAGVLPQDHWNNIRNGSGTEPSAGGLTTIMDNTGAATTASVTFASDGTWRQNNAVNQAAGDEEMAGSAIYDQLVGSTQGQIPVTVSNIPYSAYDVYVYVPGDNNSNYIDITANGKTYYGVWQNNVANIDGNTGTAFPWTQITGTNVSTTATNGRNNGNYALFKGLTGSTLNLLVKGGANPPTFNGPYNTTLSGVQIVEAPAAPPSSIGLEFAAQEVAPGGSGLAQDHVAGVFPQDHWNNLRNNSGSEPTAPTGSLATIMDNAGFNSGVTVDWTGQGTWRVNGNANNPAIGDEEMANSAVFEQAGPGDTQGQIPVTIKNVPYAKYDVYVYVPGDNDSNYIDITANGNTFYGLWEPTAPLVDGNAATPFIWTQITGTDVDTTHTNGRNGGNYALFKGLTGSQLDILVKGGANSPTFNGPYNTTLSGIQIVDASGAGSGSIAGTVFNDKNSNSVKDGADTAIAGWTIYLDTNNNSIKDAGETSIATDASGNYTFNALADGTYHVKQVLQTGYRKTLPGSGIPGYDVVVSGGAVTGKDFGDTTNIFLGGTVFNDSNSNGQKDGAEVFIQGAVINIVSNNVTVASRTTDAAGKWQVKGLSAGSGEADVVLAGYTPTNPATGKYVGSASSGQQIGNLNFGLHKVGTAPAVASASASSILKGVASDSLIEGLL